MALAYGRPDCLEQVLATRNVQSPELKELAPAWGAVKTVVICEPRMSKRGVQLEKLQKATP